MRTTAHPSSKPSSHIVSAVIPTHQRPHLIERAVRSALKQTYSAVEVIVVIDGRDEDTSRALETIRDPRVRVIALSESVGAAEARNIGVREARGKWIAFLDDDDEWLPEKIEKQMRVAEDSACRFPIVSCRIRVQTPAREYIWPRRLPNLHEPLSEYVLARRGLFQGEGVVSTITLFASRDLLLRVPFERGQRRHQEWDWLFRAVYQTGAQLYFVDEALAVWHMEEGRAGISSMNQWRYSYEWIERVRPIITARAYAAFLLTVPAAIAARSGERRHCLKLLLDAIYKGRPAAIDLFLFCGIVLIPQDRRRRFRALLSGH